MKKKYLLLIIIPIMIIITLAIVINTTKKTPNIEVYEISDTVHYKLIENQDSKNYSGNKETIIEVYLEFQNTNYEAKSSTDSMNYYIKDGFKKIPASQLKVGDKLYFKYTKVNESMPAVAYGSYLYMC